MEHTDEEELEDPKNAVFDKELRADAVTHMERAIESCKLRVSKETASLATLFSKQAKNRQDSIDDVKEMIGDMEQRVSLLSPPLSPTPSFLRCLSPYNSCWRLI